MLGSPPTLLERFWKAESKECEVVAQQSSIHSAYLVEQRQLVAVLLPVTGPLGEHGGGACGLRRRSNNKLSMNCDSKLAKWTQTCDKQASRSQPLIQLLACQRRGLSAAFDALNAALRRGKNESC